MERHNAVRWLSIPSFLDRDLSWGLIRRRTARSYGHLVLSGYRNAGNPPLPASGARGYDVQELYRLLSHDLADLVDGRVPHVQTPLVLIATLMHHREFKSLVDVRLGFHPSRRQKRGGGRHVVVAIAHSHHSDSEKHQVKSAGD